MYLALSLLRDSKSQAAARREAPALLFCRSEPKIEAMSLVEIEAQLQHLTPEELRQLALKSWTAFAEKEGRSTASNECSEDDLALLAALDEAIARAEAAPRQGYSGDEVRSRMGQWISK
jgi:hypothetical protein